MDGTLVYICNTSVFHLEQPECMGTCFFKGVECVTHMKIQVFWYFQNLGQYDLLYTYGTIAQAWYILWGKHE